MRMEQLGRLIWLCGLPCLLVLVCWRTISYPYTKVEESFTLQAVHDILSYGLGPEALTRYDHQVFPGAVPRSFVGPIVLAAVSYPFLLLSKAIGLVETSADVQVVVRLCLASMNAVSIAFFCQQCFATAPSAGKHGPAIRLREQQLQGGLFLLITAVQFHFAFWAGRTIPNSISLPFVVTAMALVARNIEAGGKRPARASRDAKTALWLLTFSAVVLRLEIVATLLPVGLFILGTGTMSTWDGFRTGIGSGAFSVLVTTMIDTYFWQDLKQRPASNPFEAFARSLLHVTTQQDWRPLWPELHALLFNVVEGKSSDWGVSPWHAYITSLIPKLLAFTGPLVLLGILQLVRGRYTTTEARARFLLLIAAAHIGTLSMLGHKEWRFAFYVLPALNFVATIGAGALLRKWQGEAMLIVLLLLQIGLSWFTGYLSTINYPGGEAMKLLHEQLGCGAGANSGDRTVVHIDVLPAMTGVSLFQSLYLQRSRSPGRLDWFAGIVPVTCESEDYWVYDKTEDLPLSTQEAAQTWSTFTHLITEAPDCRVLRSSDKEAALPAPQQPFEPFAPPISAFAGLRRKNFSQIKADLLSLPGSDMDHSLRLALPVVIEERPVIWLCRRKTNS